MKLVYFIGILLIFSHEINAKIIYTEPVKNAKYVSVNNNIIIGFDETIVNSDLRSKIEVTGAISGNVKGEILLTSDNKKVIFKPHQPFKFNEQVEVNIRKIKTSSGSISSLKYSFKIQSVKPVWDYRKSMTDEFGYTPEFKSTGRSDSLNVPALTVNISNNPTPGNLYFSNFPFSSIPNTPYLIIADNTGTISYTREVTLWALDYKRQPNGIVTYFEGLKFVGENAQHNIVDSFKTGNGYVTDHHELQLIDNGHALLMSYDPQTVNMSQYVLGGDPNATVVGLIIQEIDENKNVVFQWRSWDHMEITDAENINFTGATIDYVHGNAIDHDHDGNILISSRHLNEITKIDRSTGDIIWRLGGKNNQFSFPNDSIMFSYQHHIRRIPNGNITLFDNGNYHTPSYSRAVEYKLDEENKIATMVWQYRNVPDIHGFAMGSVQRLHNGNTIISWGATNPTVTEVTPAGEITFQMDLPEGIYTYRTFRDEASQTLNVKVVLEGYYDTLTNKMNKKDTVRIYLRNVNSPYNIVDSSKATIDSVSLTGNFRFYNVNTGMYYITVNHRNGLETWSKTGINFLDSSRVQDYDFTDSYSKAYGDNLVLVDSKYCIYSGDVNQDQSIDLDDVIFVFNDASRFITGYVNTDVNGDGITDLDDLINTNVNSNNFVIIMTP